MVATRDTGERNWGKDVMLSGVLALAAATAMAPGCSDDETTNAQGPGPTTTTGGGDGGAGAAGGAGGAGGGGGDPVVAERPSKGSSIASDEAGTTIAAANKATDSITFFDATDKTEIDKVPVGDEPVSLVFSPDGSTLYCVNRAEQTVTVITGANTATPTVDGSPIAVGSEPGHAALSPTGATLYVSNWADGTLSVIDTATRAVSTVALGGAPMAVCVTNDGDAEDGDETIYVTDFYSRPIAGVAEATDVAREGRVFAVSASDSGVSEITLDPVQVDLTGIVAGNPAEDLGTSTSTYPNQLYACAINEGKLYVTAVGASPAAFNTTTDFHQNIHGLVYAINTANDTVDDTDFVNLSEAVNALPGAGVAGEGRRFAAVPHDIAFVPGGNLAYIATLTANMLLRVDFGADPPAAGSGASNFLPTDASPTGVTIIGTEAFTYNEVGRSISHIDLALQTTTTQAIPSDVLPAAGSAGEEVLRGQRFFNTGLARWSTGAWVGCVGCHPMGTTDNVTWVFPAGPRQTVDTSATFDVSGNVQRVLNWTAIFDEIHDFELNTRGVAGGVGAIVSATSMPPVAGDRIDFVGVGGVPNPDNGFNVGSVKDLNDNGGTVDGVSVGPGVLADWDEIFAYVQSIRSPRGRAELVGDPVAGRALFDEANCEFCHGGPLWTLSEMYYTPLADTDLRLETFSANGVTSIGAVPADTTDLTSATIGATVLIGNDANGAPQRHFCVVRKVGTFDNEGPDGRGAAEIRQSGGAAQGIGGFNVPSLLNINTGAPYFHNGSAETLEDLLESAEFIDHLQAANQVFAFADAQEVADLVAFLQSIDDSTATFTVPANQIICPDDVTF